MTMHAKANFSNVCNSTPLVRIQGIARRVSVGYLATRRKPRLEE